MITFVWVEFLIHRSCSISWSFLFVMALNILMSSANRNVLDLVKSGRSFMYKTNNKSPKTDPCGIPEIFHLLLRFVIYDECLYPVN